MTQTDRTPQTDPRELAETAGLKTGADLLFRKLAAPFDETEVKFKPQAVKGNRALALAYVDVRAVMDRLDAVLGPGDWQDDYTLLSDGSVACRLSIRVGDRWVTKVDVGGTSEQPDGGDRMKSAFSDALKRTAVKFGIGRYLYRLPQVWWDYDPAKRQFATPPRLPGWDKAPPAGRPEGRPQDGPAAGPSLPQTGPELLKRLSWAEAEMVGQGLCKQGELLEMVRATGVRAGFPEQLAQWAGPVQMGTAVGAVLAFKRQKKKNPGPQAEDLGPAKVSKEQADALRMTLKAGRVDINTFLTHYKISRIDDLPASEYAAALARLEKRARESQTQTA